MKTKTLTQAIRLLFDETKLTVSELAKITGMPKESISNILRGTRDPNIKSIEKLLRGAGKTWVWLDEHLEPIELQPVVQAKRKPAPPREYPERNPLRFRMR